MLEALCGNKSVQRILIFLFVNNKCYGTQLHRALKTALTPLQKALLRLEEGGIITSFYEGKTRLYQFDPTYPLLPELEQLLKKAYTLLSAEEKKAYYVMREDANKSLIDNQLHRNRVLSTFWEKLSKVSQLTFQATTKSHEQSGWNGKGRGEVSIDKTTTQKFIFNEKGSWRNHQGGELSFSNVFRWTFDRQAGVISLEHLRRGPDHPVFLFHLAPSGTHSLSSVDSHLCEGDAYFGQIHFDRFGLRLTWRVIGPKKNEEIHYVYS